MKTWSSALFHFILASQISTGDEGDKGNREEMRIMVCGKELSFGKKEFALISGLSFKKSDHKFSLPATKPCLKMKHFPNEKKLVTGKCLKLFLFGKVYDDDDEQKSKKCSKKEDNSNAECDIFKVPLESDEKVPEESNMDDEEDEKDLLGNENGVEEEDLLGNENGVEEEDLFEKGEEEERVAPPSSQPDGVCSRKSTSIIASFESFVKNAMIGHTEDLKITVIGEMELFKSAVKGQLEELSVQVSNSHKTMLNHIGCLTAEIKSIKDKIGGTQTYHALSKTKMGTPPGRHNEEGDFDGAGTPPGGHNEEGDFDGAGTPPGGHNEEGDFDGAVMQKPYMTPGNGSNSIELNPPYPYNHPNKEVDVSRPIADNICNSSTGKKRKRNKIKPCTGTVAPIIILSDDVTKGQGRARRKINPAPSLLYPYTPTGLVAKKNTKKVPTSKVNRFMNYFGEDILDQRITKQDIDDVNRFINLGIKEHGDNYDGDGTSLLSCSEYKLLLLSTGWLSGNVIICLLVFLPIIYSALVLLHKSYPSNKSTGTWSYFESHLAFIENMVWKIHVCQVQPDFSTRYRCELAVQLFKKQFLEVNDTGGE
ncbi:hypothetical protein MKX03_023439 [Papaver bracteatum]|nr:hypothetical protein MKX03_023439 [Papaver bracteatum]